MQSEMELFVQVVDAGSFSAAGRLLGVPASTVSRQISRLEERLRARLLHRSTRALTLTEVGQVYYERAARIVVDVRDTEEAIATLQTEPSGMVRVSAPPMNLEFSYLDDLVAKFLAKYPRVRLRVELESRYVDLVAEGFDAALRGGPLRDSSLVARRLLPTQGICVASPGYLAERGTPSDPDDLAEHCLLTGSRPRWPLRDGGSVKVTGRLAANDLTILRTAALAGLGIAYLPHLYVRNDLAAGTLVQVLADDAGTDGDGFSLVFPHHRYLQAKVRAFVDFTVDYFAGLEA
jgi:DNA-binding transcriptional LysR family regulator